MALRLLDIYRPDDETALDLPDDTYRVFGHWTYAIDENKRVDRVLMEVEETESFLDWVDSTLPTEHRVVLQPVEATLPRPETDDEEDEEEKTTPEDEESIPVSWMSWLSQVSRVSRAELYEDARDATTVSGSFVALTILSTIVAAGGMLRDQTAVVIGAMMIAPLLGPSLALALGTTLGDRSLLGQSLWANALGGGLAFVSALGMGILLPVDPVTGEVTARTLIGLPDVALAAAAGAAGVIAMTRAEATGLVGVMVAVALLPPAVALGLLLGDGHLDAALQAGLLTATNVVALNLAAVCTFLAMGVRPRHWRDLEQARTSTRLALALWGGALSLLIVLLWLSG